MSLGLPLVERHFPRDMAEPNVPAATARSSHIIFIVAITVPIVFFTFLVCFFVARFTVRPRRNENIEPFSRTQRSAGGQPAMSRVNGGRSDGRSFQRSGSPSDFITDGIWDEEAGVYTSYETGTETDDVEPLPQYEPETGTPSHLAVVITSGPSSPTHTRRVSSPPPAYHMDSPPIPPCAAQPTV